MPDSAALPPQPIMISSTVEDYLKALLKHEQAHPLEPVANGALALTVGVSPGSATAMVKTLAEAGLVAHEPRVGARLTDAGRKLALSVLRRHRLIELFLVRHLKLDWSEVHEEAERLEHAVSDKVLERIAELLGHPENDPHGAPIPSASGDMPMKKRVPLAQAVTGAALCVAQVPDEPAMLRFLADKGLVPGTPCRLLAVDLVAETVTVEGPGGVLTLGLSAAKKVTVE